MSIEVHARNESGIMNARYGMYKGNNYLFTHRDPKTGYVWGEDIPVDLHAYGCWVPYDSVRWC